MISTLYNLWWLSSDEWQKVCASSDCYHQIEIMNNMLALFGVMLSINYDGYHLEKIIYSWMALNFDCRNKIIQIIASCTNIPRS